MKMNSTLAAVLIFVLVMLGSGLISGLKAYTLGYEALKEVSQPNVKPSQKDVTQQGNSSAKSQQQMIVSEAKILQTVNDKMNRSQDKAVPLDGNQASQKNNQNNQNNQNSFIESP